MDPKKSAAPSKNTQKDPSNSGKSQKSKTPQKNGGSQPPPKSAKNEASGSGSNPNPELLALFKILECPVCLEVMQQPIYNCESGHSLCMACSQKMVPPVCPLCKAKMTFLRNYKLEEISSQVGKPCPNSKYGCRYVNDPSKIEEHFESCELRQRFCPFGIVLQQCSWSGNAKDVAAHIQASHSLIKEVQQTTALAQDLQEMKAIIKGSDMFLYHVKINTKKDLAFWVIQYIGDKKKAEQFKYELMIYSTTEPAKRIKFSDSCRSYFEKIEDIYSTFRCVAIPLQVLKNYTSGKKNVLFYKFSVDQLAPENDVKNLKLN